MRERSIERYIPILLQYSSVFLYLPSTCSGCFDCFGYPWTLLRSSYQYIVISQFPPVYLVLVDGKAVSSLSYHYTYHYIPTLLYSHTCLVYTRKGPTCGVALLTSCPPYDYQAYGTERKWETIEAVPLNSMNPFCF